MDGKINRGEGDEEDDDLGYTHRMTDREEEEIEEGFLGSVTYCTKIK